MKKILIFLLSIASISTFGQSGSIAISGVKYRVNDTTAYQSAVATAHAQGYADIYWNNQATTPHWDIWNGSSYDHIFDFGSGSTYTAGSGLTLTADQFKLGGTITENTTFSNSGFNVTHASSGTRMGAFRIWATTIGLDGSTSAFIQSGDNTVTTSAASGVDIVGDSVRLATNGSQIRLNTDGSLSIDGDVGTSGQVITSNGAGPLTWETPSGGGLTVGTTTIASGTDTRVLFDNAGVLGEYAISGTGNVAMTGSPALTGTPTTPTATAGTNTTQVASTAFVRLLLPYVTPEMYGAVRDGSTDDATAITNAFASGLPVYFGPGNYRIASGIAVPAGASAFGFGESTIISTVQTTINIFTLNGRATIKNIKFLGSDLSGQVGISVADVISTSTEVGNVLDNCRFVDLRYGIQGATVYSANFEGAIQATNCQFISNVIGVWLQAGAEYNKFSNCSAVGNTTGVRWDAGNNSWTGGQITNNTTGVQFNTGSNAGKAIFSGVHVNHNTTAVLSSGITITSEFIGCNFISSSDLDITSSNIRFIGCYFNDTSSQAWSFTNGTNIVDFIDCRFGMTAGNQPTVTQSGTVINFTGCFWESGTIPSYARNSFYGATVINGRGTTSSTSSLLINNSTGGSMFEVLDDAGVRFGSAGSRPAIYPSAGTVTPSVGGASLTINASNANANSVLINQGLTQFANILALGGTFTNSSGTQSASLFKISTTINNTSTYVGTVIDLDINNTETAMVGTTHYGILERSTTALNGFGTATPTERLHVVGNGLFAGNITLSTAGNGVYIKEGSNATMGTATLSSGTVTVNTTKVTANSRIFLTVNGGTLTNVGSQYISARSAGTSFTISSTNASDASDVAWVIIEPAP